LYEECKRDKELMVVKYAQAEQRNMELADSVQKAETRVKEWTREREKAISRWNAMQADNSRLTKSLETKVFTRQNEACQVTCSNYIMFYHGYSVVAIVQLWIQLIL
jgi:uncharacterized protein (DUF3084 family)